MPLPKDEGNAAEIEADFDRIEELMKRVDIEFNAYFQGGRKTPPDEFRRQLDGIVRRYRQRSFQRYAHRFRFSSLMSAYSVNSERWSRKLKKIEDAAAAERHLNAAQKQTMQAYGVDLDEAERRLQGAEALVEKFVHHDDAAPSPAAQAGGALRPAAERAGNGAFRVRDLQGDREAVDRLFARYKEAKRAAGEDVSRLKREAFEKVVAKQLESFRGKGAGAVQFRVEEKDGKVSLKAGKSS